VLQRESEDVEEKDGAGHDSSSNFREKAFLMARKM
jgi:hypothetical protein